MTEQHPLTIAQIKKLARKYTLNVESGEYSFGEDTVRAAADWQLGQVIEWLQENLLLCDDKLEYCYLEGYPLSGAVINKDKVLEDLKQAMRPTQQEDN